MDMFNELEDINKNLKKLRDSIYENSIIDNSTEKQQDTFYKMLKTLLGKTKYYMKTFENKEHVIKTLADLEKLQETITSEDITFYINTMEEKIDWYYENETKDENGNFIAAVDVVVLWPLRAINEKMYRYLFNKTFDERFDRVFNNIGK